MRADKRTPMYESNMSNQGQYDFADYTAPTPTSSLVSLNRLNSKLKQSTVWNSQLLGIEQSREEYSGDHGHELKDKPLNGFSSNLTNLRETKEQKSNDLFSTLKIREARTFKEDENLFTTEFQKRKSSDKENLTVWQGTSNYTPTRAKPFNDEHTPDDVIEMMASPYKDSLYVLKQRLSRKNSRRF